MLVRREMHMVFSELSFLFAFLPVTLAIYYAVPLRFKNAVLFLSGLVFYSWGEPVYVIAMVLSTLIDYCAGLVMHRFDGSKLIRKTALIISVVMNLSLLGVFKYSGFAVELFNSFTGLSVPKPGLPLPIGISFFTFQSMSYTIDLYRRSITVQKNPVNFAAFVTMFPQIVAGPIVRYDDIAAELNKRKINIAGFEKGAGIFICGLAKKVLIANSVGSAWDTVKAMDYSALDSQTAWLGILAFTLQIYFDFSGYSDMAVGLGHMLGFSFPKNFNYPYMSLSISEFWRRWHMTLGGWFRSYVYIPLGGNRNGALKTIRNLLIVWFLTGLWHGASANFVIWGVYYGIIIIAEKLITRERLGKLPKAFKYILTMLLVVVGWVIFEISSPSQELAFIGAMLRPGTPADRIGFMSLTKNYAAVFIVGAVAATSLPHRLYDAALSKYPKLTHWFMTAAGTAVFIICIAYLVDADYNPFLYFNF